MSRINEMVRVSLEAATLTLQKGKYGSMTTITNKQQAVIFDLDGTLFDNRHRVHLAANKQWDEYLAEVKNDELIIPIADFLKEHQTEGKLILIWSARCESTKDITESMLREGGITWDSLMLRPIGDYRSDVVIKEQQYVSYHKANPEVEIVHAYDDRPNILALWRQYGISTTQVHLHEDIE